MQRTLPVYRLPGLSEVPDAIAARLLRHLPPNEYKFQFTVIEIPSANAFAMAGGRIFVSRRLVAALQSEDELAGILGHEMGHVLARQSSVEFSKLLRDVLKVTSVGDREDIRVRLNQLLDAPPRKGGSNREEDDQEEADRISALATWRAGYDPDGLARFFDRLTENEGDTGGFFSDLLGATRPESKRYREMLKVTQGLPASCREQRPAEDAARFQEWKRRVSELSPEDLLSGLPDREPTRKLTPKLRPDISHIQFSPDGRLLLAQDESGINVLQREPLSLLFRIPVLGAGPALFHKDSHRLLFPLGLNRVESWDLDKRARERRWDLPLSRSCQELQVSPAGNTAACTALFGAEAWLVDLETGQDIAHHEFTAIPPLAAAITLLLGGQLGESAFMADGSTFLMVPQIGGVAPWAYHLSNKKEISIGNPLRGVLHRGFAFLPNNRIAAVRGENIQNSGVFSWPDGKELDRFAIPDTSLTPSTKGDDLLLRPLGDLAVGAMSIERRTIFQGSPNPATDRYDDLAAAERATGEIALYPNRGSQASAALAMPDADLNRLRSAAHSPNLAWLVVSARTRALVWNLNSGQNGPIASFDGGYFSADGLFTANFEQREPKPGGAGTQKTTTRTTLDLGRAVQIRSERVGEPIEGNRRVYTGRYQVNFIAPANAREKAEVNTKDSVTGQTAWSRLFDGRPGGLVGNAVVLVHDRGAEADAALKRVEVAAVRSRLQDGLKQNGSALLEVIALDSGKTLGFVALRGAGSLRRAFVAGEQLFLEDANNRTLGYSLETGERNGQQFGRVLAVDPALSRVAVENQLGSIAVLDASLRTVNRFQYPRNVVYAGFDGAGKRLLVLTGEQEVFIEDLGN